MKNVKERLIRVCVTDLPLTSLLELTFMQRIQAEVATWHRLCHRNVSQFFGIFQNASSIGMVSPWYSNGIISEYVKVNPEVDRLKLVSLRTLL